MWIIAYFLRSVACNDNAGTNIQTGEEVAIKLVGRSPFAKSHYDMEVHGLLLPWHV